MVSAKTIFEVTLLHKTTPESVVAPLKDEEKIKKTLEAFYQFKSTVTYPYHIETNLDGSPISMVFDVEGNSHIEDPDGNVIEPDKLNEYINGN
jgi:hypothetical protein